MEIQVKVPTSLNEIPLKHYVDFLNVQKGSNDEEFIAQKMIEIFCGIRLADVAKIKLTSLNEMVLHFTNLFSAKPEFKQTFKIGDIEFGFIPNLEEISFGEYVDLENHLQSWETYNKAMAVMYRPIKTRSKAKQLNLPSDGDGIKAYMDSLRETLLSSMRLPNLDLLNVSPISPSRSKKTKLREDNLKDK